MHKIIAAGLVMLLASFGLSRTEAFFPAQDEKKSAEAERDELKRKLAELEKAHQTQMMEMHKARKAEHEQIARAIGELKQALQGSQNEKNALAARLLKMEAAMKILMLEKEADLEKVKLKADLAELQLEQVKMEMGRVAEEVKGLFGALKKREGMIGELEGEIKKLREMKIRTQIKPDQQKPANLPIVRDPNAFNPPVTSVKGNVIGVNPKDNSIVQISLGTDHGVQPGHTLEVYRIKPKAQYLGTLRVVDSSPHQCVAKLMKIAQPVVLQVGDIVVNQISDDAPAASDAAKPKSP